MTLKEAVSYLEARKASSEAKSISFAGISIPANFVNITAPTILLLLSAFAAVHLGHLHRQKDVIAETSRSFSWVALFPDVTSRVLTGTFCMLPAAAVAVLAARSWTLTNFALFAYCAVCFLLLVLLGVKCMKFIQSIRPQRQC
jgi:hypothetical protein